VAAVKIKRKIREAGALKEERSPFGRRQGDKEAYMVAQEALKLARETRKATARNRRDHEQHLVDCTAARVAAKASTDALIIKTDQQTLVLNDVAEILPAMKEWYVGKKSRERFWKALGDFFFNMMRKNLDSLSGKLILIAVGGVLVYRGASLNDVLKAMLGH
jgi:hypothetical protein